MSQLQTRSTAALAHPTAGPPSVLDASAWAAPADPVAIAGTVSVVLALVEPGHSDARAAAVGRAVAQRGYSAAEIKLIEREAPFRNHYGGSVKLSVLDEIVTESRALRSRLASGRLTADAVADVCASAPELDADDFEPCGFDDRNRTLYLHAPEVAARRRARAAAGQPVPDATPETEDTRPAYQIAERSGLSDFAGIAEQIQAAREEEANRQAGLPNATAPRPRPAARSAPRVAVADDPKTGDAAGRDLSRGAGENREAA